MYVYDSNANVTSFKTKLVNPIIYDRDMNGYITIYVTMY